MFVEAPILNHFDLECHIWIETDTSGYAIGEILSQLTSDDSGQWHLVAFFSRKMILVETRYKTQYGELLAIVVAFKTWRHNLKSCKYEVLILIDHNNLQRFMDTQSLSSKQVQWAQELSRYHFEIDYQQGKADRAADTLSRYSRWSAEEEKTLQAKNTKILHRLQFLLTWVSGLSVSGMSILGMKQ